MKPEEFTDLVAYLEETPAAVESLTEGLEAKELRWKPSVEEFSFLENVCHLSDIEREGYQVRIEKLLTEETPLLPDLDGPALARERGYNHQEFAPALETFAATRRDNVARIKKLAPDDLSRSGTFENVGPVTLESLLFMMREHDESHREELQNLRARLLRKETI